MKRIVFLSVWILLGGLFKTALAQTTPTPFLIRGYVIGSDTNSTIPLANILKKPSGERYISNRYGAFGIQVKETDTLVFSVIGYQNYILPVKKYVLLNLSDPIRVKLKPAIYRLKDAEINYNKHKRDSVARLAAKILKTSPLLNNYEHVNSWITGSSGSVVTDMFAGSNSQLQQYLKLERLIALYHEQELVDDKYTDDLIIRSTGILPEKVLEFKKYCNLPHYFILNSNDYDLVLAIRSCYADFARNQK
ncbi:MAG: hypothetical protein CFE21_11205 [Bacteroidetes bacterium B1(2017)]|nr:MAG: hypothetical protein CFE21_11205 [Bacteroidetes bacterium B1(2017)]